MDLYVLDTNLDVVYVDDIYESLIWTDRYWECGDFELYTPLTENLISMFQKNYYIWQANSEHLMIIEKIKIETDAEEGTHATITGRSLESILDRRIIWGLKTLSGNFQSAIETLLNECIISPSDSDRRISNFIFQESADSVITSMTIDAQYTGDNLYEVICDLCNDRGLGFKVTLNDNKQFVFQLYRGEDHSYEQTANPYVIFSPDFENIINSSYLESNESLKTITLIGGEGEGTERKYASLGSGSGLERRELFTDARDISSDTLDEEEILDASDDAILDPDGDALLGVAPTYVIDAKYTELLEERGSEKLAENTEVTSFEGEVETTVSSFQYGKDYFIGDIVEIENEYGHEARARVLEFITSESDSGISYYPTFSTVEGESE